MLAGMLAPTNLGEDYQKGFQNVFGRLSSEYQNSIVFVPFLLDGVAGDPNLNQADGIHPNAQGARVIAERGVCRTGAGRDRCERQCRRWHDDFWLACRGHA